jgi:hypothetical protein
MSNLTKTNNKKDRRENRLFYSPHFGVRAHQKQLISKPIKYQVSLRPLSKQLPSPDPGPISGWEGAHANKQSKKDDDF